MFGNKRRKEYLVYLSLLHSRTILSLSLSLSFISGMLKQIFCTFIIVTATHNNANRDPFPWYNCVIDVLQQSAIAHIASMPLTMHNIHFVIVLVKKTICSVMFVYLYWWLRAAL